VYRESVFGLNRSTRIYRRRGRITGAYLPAPFCFFFDRYSDLADFHRMKGRTAKADTLAARAEAHYRAAPDEPMEIAIIVMTVARSYPQAKKPSHTENA
jgi:hypothetical protein